MEVGWEGFGRSESKVEVKMVTVSVIRQGRSKFQWKIRREKVKSNVRGR